MSDFVRVQTENGLHGTVPRAHAEATGLKILDGVDAVDRYGQPLGQSHPEGETPDVVTPGESPYEGQSFSDLKAEIDRRNATRPEDQQISAGRSQADALAALIAADGA